MPSSSSVDVRATWRSSAARVDIPAYPVALKSVAPGPVMPSAVFYAKSSVRRVYACAAPRSRRRSAGGRDALLLRDGQLSVRTLNTAPVNGPTASSRGCSCRTACSGIRRTGSPGGPERRNGDEVSFPGRCRLDRAKGGSRAREQLHCGFCSTCRIRMAAGLRRPAGRATRRRRRTRRSPCARSATQRAPESAACGGSRIGASDGSWAFSAPVPEASWATGIATLATLGEDRDRARSSVGWLLEQQRRSLGWYFRSSTGWPRASCPVRLNPDLRGWPWRSHATGFVEPTAYSLIVHSSCALTPTLGPRPASRKRRRCSTTVCVPLGLELRQLRRARRRPSTVRRRHGPDAHRAPGSPGKRAERRQPRRPSSDARGGRFEPRARVGHALPVPVRRGHRKLARAARTALSPAAVPGRYRGRWR